MPKSPPNSWDIFTNNGIQRPPNDPPPPIPPLAGAASNG